MLNKFNRRKTMAICGVIRSALGLGRQSPTSPPFYGDETDSTFVRFYDILLGRNSRGNTKVQKKINGINNVVNQVKGAATASAMAVIAAMAIAAGNRRKAYAYA